MSQSPEYSADGNLFCCEDAADVLYSSEEVSIFHHPPSSYLPPYSPPSDEITIDELIDVESHHMPNPDYFERLRHRPIDFTNREKSINWIYKVHAHFQFRPVTALLSVNYFDRFLSCSSLPQPAGWPFHLLSVACLSLAAKMEEPQIPNLLDLQLFEPGFVFDSKTVQRMELRILTQLNWRLRSVTPFDYLHYFLSKLPTSSSDPKPGSVSRFFDASQFILATTWVIDFFRFAPSAVAAAAALCSAGIAYDVYPKAMPCFHGRVNNEMVRSCHQLMEEYVADTCRRGEAVPPSSPVGVLDAATLARSDTRAENPGSTAQANQRPSKRLRSSAPYVQRQ